MGHVRGWVSGLGQAARRRPNIPAAHPTLCGCIVRTRRERFATTRTAYRSADKTTNTAAINGRITPRPTPTIMTTVSDGRASCGCGMGGFPSSTMAVYISRTRNPSARFRTHRETRPRLFSRPATRGQNRPVLGGMTGPRKGGASEASCLATSRAIPRHSAASSINDVRLSGLVTAFASRVHC